MKLKLCNREMYAFKPETSLHIQGSDKQQLLRQGLLSQDLIQNKPWKGGN